MIDGAQLWRSVNLCSSLYLLTRAHCARCSPSIPLRLASYLFVPAGGRTRLESPDCALRIPVYMIGKELVFLYVVSAAHFLAVSAAHFSYKCRNDKWNPIQNTGACNFRAKRDIVARAEYCTRRHVISSQIINPKFTTEAFEACSFIIGSFWVHWLMLHLLLHNTEKYSNSFCFAKQSFKLKRIL